MESEINQLRQDKHHHIIINIDANETHRKTDRSKIGDFIKRVGLIDCHQFLHPDLEETPTYVDGSTQIDYCFATVQVVEAIRQCGITPLNYVVQGADHRSLWIDVDVDLLLGGKVKEHVHAPIRGLKLKNIKALKKYQTFLQDYLKQHRMREKLTMISREMSKVHRMRDEEEREKHIQGWAEQLDKWDELFINLMLKSEKKCSKTGLTRTYLWSKPLMLAGQRITYLKARKRALQNGHTLSDLSGYAKYLHDQFGYDNMEMTKESVQKQLKEAWKDLRAIQKEDRMNRQDFLEELAIERASQQNIKVESAIKQIQNAEATSDTHSKLNYYLKHIQKGAISHLLIPDGEDKEGPYGKRWKK